MAEISLSVENVEKSFQGTCAVSGVSFTVRPGEVVGLLGPNGAGKTTTFHMVVGLQRPDKGNIFLNGENITDFPIHRRALLGMSYLPQESSIFRKLSAYDNIYAVLEARGFPHGECRKRTEELIGEFSLGKLSHSLGGVLSGGERRRVEIARSISTSPHFILLDEPFAGIDPIAVEEIQSIIRILADKGVGILITDHNVRETLKICDQAHIIISGVIEHEGSPSQIAQNEEVREKYLGKGFHL